MRSSLGSPLIDVDLSAGDVVRLGALEVRRCKSERARSNELRGWRIAEGERGAGMAAEGSGAGSAFGFEKDIDLSDVGVDSSIAEGAPVFCPPAA